jgi:hypothetical protein
MSDVLKNLCDALAHGRLVPFVGDALLQNVTHTVKGHKIPATSDELILAMNQGRPMAPKLMYEFPRAAMNIELKRGRSAVNRFLLETYDDPHWSPSPLHEWLAGLNLPYLIDLNRDTGLQKCYATRPHTLVVGVARISGTAFRFKLYSHDGTRYGPSCEESAIDPDAPVLFKPCGTPWPEPNWLASDADFVDYLTELMGGFGMPAFLKKRREGLRYMVGGLRLNRDTQRMLLSDIIYGAAQPSGVALLPEANAKETRFCARIGLEVLPFSLEDLMRFSLANAPQDDHSESSV